MQCHSCGFNNKCLSDLLYTITIHVLDRFSFFTFIIAVSWCMYIKKTDGILGGIWGYQLSNLKSLIFSPSLNGYIVHNNDTAPRKLRYKCVAESVYKQFAGHVLVVVLFCCLQVFRTFDESLIQPFTVLSWIIIVRGSMERGLSGLHCLVIRPFLLCHKCRTMFPLNTQLFRLY